MELGKIKERSSKAFRPGSTNGLINPFPYHLTRQIRATIMAIDISLIHAVTLSPTRDIYVWSKTLVMCQTS